MAEIREGRRVGNSTRQANEYIEELFEKKEIVVSDHAGRANGRYIQADKYLFDMIVRRLSIEHGGAKLKISKERLTIKLL